MSSFVAVNRPFSKNKCQRFLTFDILPYSPQIANFAANRALALLGKAKISLITKSFERHLPKPKPQPPEQLSLLEGES